MSAVPRSRARLALPLAALALLGAVYLLDLAGVLLSRSGLWHAAGAATWPALLAMVLAAAIGWTGYHRGRGQGSATRHLAPRHLLVTGAGLALYALSRWVRGAADVPPDPVLLWSQGVALSLLAWGTVGRRTGT
jgi:uncharacterized membrane protein YbhN (UPF0104 family)